MPHRGCVQETQGRHSLDVHSRQAMDRLTTQSVPAHTQALQVLSQDLSASLTAASLATPCRARTLMPLCLCKFEAAQLRCSQSLSYCACASLRQRSLLKELRALPSRQLTWPLHVQQAADNFSLFSSSLAERMQPQPQPALQRRSVDSHLLGPGSLFSAPRDAFARDGFPRDAYPWAKQVSYLPANLLQPANHNACLLAAPAVAGQQ